MENKTYRWVEKPSVILLRRISVGIFGILLIYIISSVVLIYNDSLSKYELLFKVLIPLYSIATLSLIPMVWSNIKSDKYDFTKLFLAEINSELSECYTLETLKSLRDKFIYETFDEKYIARLGNVSQIGIILNKINSKIELLELIKEKNENK